MAKTFDVNATNDELEAFAASAGTTAAPEKKKANVFYRLLALVLAAFPILFFCLHPLESGTVLNNYIENIFTDFIGNLEMWFGSGVEMIVYYIPTLALPIIMLVCAILAIVALFSGKAAPGLARTIAWLNFWSIGAMILGDFTLYYFMGASGSSLLSFLQASSFMEMPSYLYILMIAGFMGLVGWILSVVNSPKKVWVSTLMFIFAFAFNVVIIYFLRLVGDENGLSKLYADKQFGLIFYYATLAIVAFSTLGMLITSGMLARKKGFGGNLFVAIVHIVITVALLVVYLLFWQQGLFAQRLEVAGTEYAFSGYVGCLLVLGAICLLELIISIVRLCIKEKAKKVAVEAPVEETPAEETAEVEEEVDYVEAVPYQPAPETYYAEEAEEEVVAVEEEVEEEPAIEAQPTPVAQPVPAAQPAPVATATAGETKLDDPFIATLTDEERKKFADVFILKSQGDFPGVPDYKTGEDNSAFFRKIFVYLGKYRARIPDDVLAKIYDFSINQ